jgi:hypothetical protein
MTRDMQVIWVKSEPEYFCEEGWTGSSVICPSGIMSSIDRAGVAHLLIDFE